MNDPKDPRGIVQSMGPVDERLRDQDSRMLHPIERDETITREATHRRAVRDQINREKSRFCWLLALTLTIWSIIFMVAITLISK